ncbi:MAG UNVERIFIED_CONTAM: hypothetical protein LVR18_51445 [Planctomycetaceae bacterium]
MRPDASYHRSQFKAGRLANRRQSGLRRPTSPRPQRISRLIRMSLTPAAGIVPATGALSSDYYESSGSIGFNNRCSSTQAAIPEAAGIVPATGVAE